MKTFQEDVIARLDAIVQEANCRATIVPEFGNTGAIIARRGAKTVARLTYHFQLGRNKILFNDRQQLDPTNMTYLFAEHDDGKIAAMLDQWATLLGDDVLITTPAGNVVRD